MKNKLKNDPNLEKKIEEKYVLTAGPALKLINWYKKPSLFNKVFNFFS
ncbi:MAG: hypothetical protein GY830_06915 [Bacteroidetes bacterium]|nr:hypothetical protein [Bacteroidota bacterium]